ncbi:MAG: hypothetical protein WCF23_11385 [Candidatus Nitrosopolaris sp.]
MLNNDKGNVVPSEQDVWPEILSVAIISSLIIAAAVVTSLLYELPLSVYARSNNVAAIPFLPPSSNYSTESSQKSTPTTNDTSSQSTSTHQRSNEGTLTIKQVILGTEKLLPNSKFKITPNPFTLKGSLIIHDNNSTLDFDPASGVIVLRNVKFSPYLINETSSPGFGAVLLKTRITLHETNPNPIVTIENRQLNLPFTGSAIVTAPYLNDSSLRTFIANGATIAGRTPISKVDQLPSGLLISSEKQTINSTINASLSLKPITFKTSVPATTSASQIYKLFRIPTYPAPVKDIASHIIYVSPAFVVEQQGSGNSIFTLTPIIAKIFPGMTVMLNHNSSVGSGLAKVENVKMKFAESANNIGFSFGISDNIPTSIRLPKVPVDTVALFINVGYIGVGGGVTSAIKVVNFSNPKLFASSPDISILVRKSSPHLAMSKLPDGCPNISLYSFNESIAKWQQLDKPIRAAMLDIHDECGYILQTQHFSKFAVGGILEQ